MTTTFLGKWRLSFQWSIKYNNFVVWRPHRSDRLTDLYTYTGAPGSDTNIAFIRGADSKLRFQFNNGKFVKCDIASFRYTDTLADAAGFSFPNHDQGDPPASFKGKVVVVGTDRFMTPITGMVLATPPAPEVVSFFINQITPSLAGAQTKGNADGLDFAWVDLTGGKLEKVSLIKSDFSYCNLTNFKFINCVMKRAILDNCIPAGADFSGSVLAGASLKKVDLTLVLANAPLPEFYIKPLQPPSPDNPRTTFAGSCLKQSLLGSDWSMLDLSGTTIVDLPTPLSSQAKPLQVKYSILTGLNQNDFSDLSLQYAVFDNAMLDNVNLNGADLSNASFIQASMHNTVLSNATLKNAVMTGAQLGSLGSLFNLPAGYESHLNAGPKVDDALRDQFKQHGITLSADATLNTLSEGRVWQLNDAGNRIMYTVRLETTSDSTHAITVYKPGIPASLVNAYMPNAILTGANLYGVTANNIQFYGSNARLDGSAILEEAKLNNSNLSTVNFTQAQLMGTNLSNCHLFNAKFNAANLTPSAAHTVTDLSHSNLQGANFTDAKLYGANLTNAAVAINVPTKFNPKQGGVYLFSLPYKGDNATLDAYTAELNAAAKSFFSFNPGGSATDLQKYLTALRNNDLNTLRIAFLRHSITLSTDAKIQIVEVDLVWQIVDGAKSYTLWTDTDDEGKIELYASSSLTKTRAAFQRSSVTLRWQASATVDTTDQQWLLDNDSENPKNFSTGYVKFILKLNDKVLDVYGAALRILRMGDKNQEEYFTETCQITTLAETNMNADTICPNGRTLAVNQSSSGKRWDTLWLRAVQPPRPPDCVPTNNSWCPPPTMKM